MVLSTKLDQELITGDGGFMAAANPAIAKPGNPAAVATYGDFVKGVSDQVDGLYADTVAGVRILLGPSAYKLGLGTYRAGTAAAPSGGDMSALERVQQLSGGVRASSHIPAVSGKVEQALAARATGLTHMVQPVWQGPTSAVAFVATDTGVDLLGLAADDPRLPTFTAPVVVVARAFYDGSPRISLSYDFLVKSLRRIV